MPRTLDIIPTRLRFHFLLLLVGAASIGALLALQVCSPRLGQWIGQGRIDAFNLAGRGTVATWFSSMLLALAGILAVMVYTIRRHRRDDYRGHYRILALGRAGLVRDEPRCDRRSSPRPRFALTTASGTPLYGDGEIWWMIPYGFFFGGIGIRLLLDMRPSPLSTGALLAYGPVLPWGGRIAIFPTRWRNRFNRSCFDAASCWRVICCSSRR